MKTVKIYLYEGDARDVNGGSFMSIMGFNNPLKQEIESDTKAQFKPFSLPRQNGTHVNGDILRLKPGSEYFWYYSASLKTKFKNDIWERPSTDLTVLIAYAHLFLKCYSFTILPLSWRHPHRVAASTLFSIWFLAYFSREILHTDDKHFPLSFTLASIDSIKPYEEFLYPDSDKLWEYIEAVNSQALVLPFFRSPLKREEVIFDVKTL